MSIKAVCLGIVGQDCRHTYVVQAGDTCGSIAKSYGISAATLLANNPNTLDCFIHSEEVMKRFYLFYSCVIDLFGHM